MLMRLRMLKLRVGKGRQVMKQLCLNTALQYVLYRALVCIGSVLCINPLLVSGIDFDLRWGKQFVITIRIPGTPII